jgi:hypothetical protein
MVKVVTLAGLLAALFLVAAGLVHLVLEHRCKAWRRERKLRHGIKAARWKVLSDLMAARKTRRITYRADEPADRNDLTSHDEPPNPFVSSEVETR